MSTSDARPGPERRLRWRDFRIRRPLLYFGLLGGATVWYLQLLLKYAFTSHSCFPANLPATNPSPPHLDWLGALQYGIDAGALAIAILAAYVSYADWVLMNRQAALDDSAPTSVLETADRFFVFWGMLCAYLFIVAIIFDFIFVGVLRICF